MPRLLVCAGLALTAAACGDSAPATPVTAASGPARRIVCANAAAAEFVCRLVPPERVAGIAEQADDYVSIDLKAGGFERVPRFPRYVAEALLVLAPDLVVTHEWQSQDTTSILRSQKVDVLVLKSATSYEDIRDTLLDLGQRFAVLPRAEEIVLALDIRVEALRAQASKRAAHTALVYTNDGTGGTTAGAHTTPDTILRLVGLKNAAAEAGLTGHVALDFERLLTLDPDFLIVSSPARGDVGSATKSVVESAPALAGLRARKQGRIVVITATLMAADSPPIVDAAEAVARAVDALLAEPPR
ncbi:MAG: ABC transporter substrate-binding protein [Planctomycetes bacterium]|nr:ABC transporter substrate-binding protein [Planctomycetota bacterium]